MEDWKSIDICSADLSAFVSLPRTALFTIKLGCHIKDLFTLLSLPKKDSQFATMLKMILPLYHFQEITPYLKPQWHSAVLNSGFVSLFHCQEVLLFKIIVHCLALPLCLPLYYCQKMLYLKPQCVALLWICLPLYHCRLGTNQRAK